MVSLDPTVITTIFLVGTIAICVVVNRHASLVTDERAIKKVQLWAIVTFVAWSALFLFAFSRTDHLQYLLKPEPLPAIHSSPARFQCA